MAQDRKYWMTKILAGHAQEEMVKKGETFPGREISQLAMHDMLPNESNYSSV